MFLLEACESLRPVQAHRWMAALSAVEVVVGEAMAAAEKATVVVEAAAEAAAMATAVVAAMDTVAASRREGHCRHNPYFGSCCCTAGGLELRTHTTPAHRSSWLYCPSHSAPKCSRRHRSCQRTDDIGRSARSTERRWQGRLHEWSLDR